MLSFHSGDVGKSQKLTLSSFDDLRADDQAWIRAETLFYFKMMVWFSLISAIADLAKDDDIIIRIIGFDNRQLTQLTSGKVNRTWFDYQTNEQRKEKWVFSNNQQVVCDP